jgi:hypothetical protein
MGIRRTMKYLKNKVDTIANFMKCFGMVQPFTAIALTELALAIVMIAINPWLAIVSVMLLLDALLFVCAYRKYLNIS